MTFEDLPEGSLWRHHNGNLYRVFAHANVEGTKPDYPQTVAYQNIHTGKIYARKLADWARSFTRVAEGGPDDVNPVPPGGWWCFHCGVRFVTPRLAREHFGATPVETPACISRALQLMKPCDLDMSGGATFCRTCGQEWDYGGQRPACLPAKGTQP